MYSGTPHTNWDDLVVTNSSGNTGITIATDNASYGRLSFADPENSQDGYIDYDHSTQRLHLGAGTFAMMTIDGAATKVAIGTTSYTASTYAHGTYIATGLCVAGGLFFGTPSTTTGTNQDYFRFNDSTGYDSTGGQWNFFADHTNYTDSLYTQADGCVAGGAFYCNGNAGKTTGIYWVNTSDARIKIDIRDLTETADPLDVICRLKGRTFKWKNPEKHGSNGGDVVTGFIAQEVEAIKPDWVQNTDQDFEGRQPGEPGVKHTNLAGLECYLVEAIKKLKTIVDAQAERIAALEAAAA